MAHSLKMAARGNTGIRNLRSNLSPEVFCNLFLEGGGTCHMATDRHYEIPKRGRAQKERKKKKQTQELTRAPRGTKIAGKPFQEGMSDTHSLLEISDSRRFGVDTKKLFWGVIFPVLFAKVRTGESWTLLRHCRGAYAGVDCIKFTPADGLHCRRDVGHRAAKRPLSIALVGSTRGSSSQTTIDEIKAGTLDCRISQGYQKVRKRGRSRKP